MWPQQLERWQDLARFTPLRTAAGGTITSDAGEQVGVLVRVAAKEDLAAAEKLSNSGGFVVMDCAAEAWKVIPAENLVAAFQAGSAKLIGAATSADDARVMLEALEVGTAGVLLRTEDPSEVRKISGYLQRRREQGASALALSQATITRVSPVGMADRVCVDLASMLAPGEGMLVGSFSRALFLVHSEVHAYIMVPGGKTAYLSELKSGSEVLVADAAGRTRTAVVGRCKVEARPMVLVEATLPGGAGGTVSTLLQNAETVRLVGRSGGDGVHDGERGGRGTSGGDGSHWRAVSVSQLAAGDKRALCESLGVFFNASYNASNPWNDTTGWELTQTLGCARLVTPAAAARPAYCQWPGIACCGPADAAAGRCKVVHAIANLSLAVNQVNCSVSDPRFLGVLDQLHACGMVVLNLEANEIGGALPQGRLGRLTNLVILDLANNWINGTIPDDLAKLTRLRRLGLGTNFLSGTIGDWVGGLVGLEVLELGANSGVNPPDPVTGEELAGIVGTVPQGVAQLTKLVELNLQPVCMVEGGSGRRDGERGAMSGRDNSSGSSGPTSDGCRPRGGSGRGGRQWQHYGRALSSTNALSGTIPRQLCGPTTRLRVLNMRSNRLTGSPAGVVNCTKLTQLDLSMNQFTGSAPATQGWEQLVQLALGNNNFEGTIPVDIYFAPTLAYLDISDNRLTGTINININLMTYLTELDLSHNQLSGELGPDIFYLPQLSRLNLAGNNFEGTISESIGLAYSLTELMLSNNTGLIGPMPNDAAFLRYLQRLSATKTNMSCVPAKEVVAAKRAREAALNASLAGATGAAAAGGWWPKCNPEKRLPCFLEFAEYDIPRSDSSNMRCFPVRRKPQAEAQVDCRTGSAFGLLDDAVQAEQQQWDLSPSYYQYANCRCLSGFREVWTRNGTHLACEANPKSQPLPPWAWVFVALGAVLAVLAAAILSLGSRLVLFRTRWAREMELKRKRARGSPKGGGTISVVVTDIEGYSELMKTSPSLTTKALNLHNAVLKKAAHFHAGHVFEQEGDSWAVAFHDAQDAVAFCMQAQQALHKVRSHVCPARV
ncbi:hypothetical protein MNEG_3403 [Monoraphidium neglectum]|uniref:Adenylate cyclase n=1 Tax=Monoraphidium neglectum TaxID=145388 RepID=A0A0D2K1V4_9CHLO|nr:hypothetical protein MNEG_3403 [Monoraphidium neglectum]KIZ04553.1 hypothetical protein MNEG_3403 [Monoraphidium neglectum]|eukprot:XP_013903572.1 hypothetical protein MNEG_3403 [Monoraphidium neglectum]